MQAPGYIDGHFGEWLATYEVLEQHIRLLACRLSDSRACDGRSWSGAHVGYFAEDAGRKPRFNHGFTMEHFGFSTPEQIQRISSLGAQVR